MFVDYVTGQLGSVTVSSLSLYFNGVCVCVCVCVCVQDQRFCSSIVRVIVAGNSISHKTAKSTENREKKVSVCD